MDSFGVADMYGLRWVFLLACLGCVALVAWNGRWEGRLTRGGHTWIVNLGRAPIWAPPPEPAHTTFQKDFKESEGLPAADTPGLTIKRVLKVDGMAVDLLLYLWPVTVVGGLLYLSTRGKRRDLALHLGLSAGIGLTAGAAVCFGLWLLFGGWGPPAPEFFGGLGLVGGIIGGRVSFKRGSAEPSAAGACTL
jgi:hypothetical protein